MKNNLEMSFWQQSSYLYGYGFIINLTVLLVKSKPSIVLENLKCKGFNIYAYALIGTYCYLGIITGGIIKHLSSIVKTFATSSALFLTAILSYFLFDFDMKYPFNI